MRPTANYEITVSDGMTRIRFLSDSSYEDFEKATDEIVANHHPQEKRLWDLRDTRYRLTMDELEGISAYGRLKLPNPARVAVLVSEVLAFGIGRQFEVFRTVPGKTEAKVFFDESQAIAWLNSSE